MAASDNMRRPKVAEVTNNGSEEKKVVVESSNKRWMKAATSHAIRQYRGAGSKRYHSNCSGWRQAALVRRIKW